MDQHIDRGVRDFICVTSPIQLHFGHPYGPQVQVSRVQLVSELQFCRKVKVRRLQLYRFFAVVSATNSEAAAFSLTIMGLTILRTMVYGFSRLWKLTCEGEVTGIG
jgi:hypothetical protein